MVGKRRPHKTRPPYKRIVGTAVRDAAATEAEADSDVDLDAVDIGGLSLAPREEVDGGTRGAPSTPGDFPLEIIDMICAQCEKKFPLMLVNRRWHLMALPHVYAEPGLTPTSFPHFVQAISSDRELGSNVRALDLSTISQVGKNSMVSRLLRRCSPKLEVFVAPQSHFGYSPMISLAGCERLKYLDLGLVSETLDLAHLFATIQKFHELEVLHFPRSSIKCDDNEAIEWAPNLRQLGLSGGFPSRFLEQTAFPPTLTTLSISNCPYLGTTALNKLLERVGPQLLRLSLAYPVPHLSADAADCVLMQCPNLRVWQVSVDYVSSAALDADLIPHGHPLRQLMLLSSGLMGHSDKIKPAHVLMATDELVHLRRLSASLLLGWHPESEALNGLVDVLNERGGGVWMI